MGFFNRLFKAFAVLGTQVIYSLNLYFTSLLFSGIATTVVLAVLEIIGKSIGMKIWLFWLLLAVPVWLGFEIYTIIKAVKFLKSNDVRKKTQDEILKYELKQKGK
jgi:hypothetical protein